MKRDNKDISGIKLFDYEYKLLQYADDTTFLLDGSEKSLKFCHIWNITNALKNPFISGKMT